MVFFMFQTLKTLILQHFLMVDTFLVRKEAINKKDGIKKFRLSNA